MARWRALILGLIALLFAVSGVARAAPPPGEAPPCHMTAHKSGAPKGSGHADMMAMNCCVGCLAGLAAPVPTPARLARSVVIAFPAVDIRRDGLAPSPELGPPRTP
jgi:hypothetical protein